MAIPLTELEAAYLREHPMCERCEDFGRTSAASLVVYVIDDPFLRHRAENMQAVCASCAERLR